MKRVLLFAIIATAALMPVRAQSQTDTIAQVNVFNNRTTTGVSALLPNIGQASHWISYCPNVNVTAIAVWLEASMDGTSFYQVSDRGTHIFNVNQPCWVLQASGVFKALRINLGTLTGSSPSVTVHYSASKYSIPNTTRTFSPDLQHPYCAYSSTVVINAGATAPLVTYAFFNQANNPAGTLQVCSISVSNNGNTTAGAAGEVQQFTTSLCAGGSPTSTIFVGPYFSTTAPTNFSYGSGTGVVFDTNADGSSSTPGTVAGLQKSLCFVNNANTATTVSISFNFT